MSDRQLLFKYNHLHDDYINILFIILLFFKLSC